MFCPSCRSEFREGVVECPECQERLVAALPPEGDPQAHEMDYVQVFETSDTSLLPLVRSVLEGAGIQALVDGGEALGVLPLGGFGSGKQMHGVAARVHVPREQEAEARALLEELDGADSSEE